MQISMAYKHKRRTQKKSVFSRQQKKMEFKNDMKGTPFQFEKRMMNAERLPELTFGKVVYRGASIINLGNKMGGNGATNHYQAGRQRTFILNTPGRIGDFQWYDGRPAQWEHLVNGSQGVQKEANALFPGMSGYPAYWAQWARLYKSYLCLSSTFTFKITPPVFPAQVLIPNKIPGEAGTNPGREFPDQYWNENLGERTLPNASCGYFYIRHCYYVQRKGSSYPERVGHPMVGNGLDEAKIWPDLRTFLNDKSVSWQKDELPRVSVTGFTIPAKPYTNNRSATLSLQDASQVQYSAQFSKKTISFTVKYSRKEHQGVDHVMSDSEFKLISDSFEKDTEAGSLREANNANYARKLYRVRLGYIAFDASGAKSFMVPIDNQAERNVEIEATYSCAFKGPRVDPFGDKKLNDGRLGNEMEIV